MGIKSVPAPENWMDLKPHPLAAAFPPIIPETFIDLCDSIKNHGFDRLSPIALYGGMVLDGLNRLAACIETKNTPSFVEFSGSEDDAIDFVLRRNILRRDLTKDAKCQIVIDLELKRTGVRAGVGKSRTPLTNTHESYTAMIAQLSGANKTSGFVPAKNPVPAVTVGNLAKTAGTATRTMQLAFQARTLAPELVEDIKAGKVSAIRVVKRASAKAKPKPEAKPPAVDSEGVEIHPKASGALTEGVREFKRIYNALLALKRDCDALAKGPYGRLIHAASLDTDIKNVARAIRFASPHSSCPMNADCTHSCKLCRGTQWIGKLQFDSLPASYKPEKTATTKG